MDTWVRLRRRPTTGDDARFLDEVEQRLAWGPRAGAHLTLEMRLALRPMMPLDREHPLDEFVLPLVQRLGPVRFDAVLVVKERSEATLVRVSPSRPASFTAFAASTAEPQVRARVTASATTIDWKEQLYDATRAVTPAPAPPGPLTVRIRLGVSRQRNWSALWRPTLDSLGPILGVPDSSRPFLAARDRITRLELHRRLDETVGQDVDVEVWWSSGFSAAGRP